MPYIPEIESNDKVEIYEHILKHLKTLVIDETDFIANLSNTSAMLGNHLPDINWAGFYLLKTDQLVLGPFWGRPAVTRIAIGDGVCGTAIKEAKNQVVPKVCDFPGHITCDILSQSEIVILFYKEDRLLGVLDIDSPSVDRFDTTDEKYLMKLLTLISTHSQI